MWESWAMEQELTKFMYLDELKNNPYEPVTMPIRRYFADGMTFTAEAAKYLDALKQTTLTLPAPGHRRNVT
jgi:hypothetical protein